MNNLILHSKISDPATAGKFGISTYSHPFTLNSDLLSQQSLEQRISDFGVAITVLCAYAFVPAAVMLYLVREYVTQEKRLIFICGVKPSSKTNCFEMKNSIHLNNFSLLVINIYLGFNLLFNFN